MNRRKFLNQLGYGIAASTVGWTGICAGRNSLPNGKKPNILFIMADDLGFSDVGCYGGEIETPNLDRLARSGLRFRNAYNYAVCVPTRTSLMTGLHPHQAEIGRGFESFGKLRTDVPTVAELLRNSGYRTYLSGKWHLGEGERRPTARGFDRFFGIEDGASNYFKSDHIRPTPVYLDEDRVALDEDFYMTDAITDHAVRFLSDAAKSPQPFFLDLSYTAPHFPLHARQEDIAKYRGKYMKGWDHLREQRYERQGKLGLFDGSWKLPDRDELSVDLKWEELSLQEKKDWDLHMAVYAAQVDVMDQGIGRVFQALKENGMEKNTLVLFMSDNGAAASRLFETKDGKKAQGIPPGPAESYKAYGLWWANASNTPFRLYKTLLHEGGIACPFIASWPGVIAPDPAFSDEPLHITDVPATFLEVAGSRYPNTYHERKLDPMEGRSFLGTLRGQKQTSERDLCWSLWGNKAIRRGDWKLVLRSNRLIESSFARWRYEPAPHEEKWELYNLASDRTETNNLAQSHPEKLQSLSEAYQRWSERTGAVELAETG